MRTQQRTATNKPNNTTYLKENTTQGNRFSACKCRINPVQSLLPAFRLTFFCLGCVFLPVGRFFFVFGFGAFGFFFHAFDDVAHFLGERLTLGGPTNT